MTVIAKVESQGRHVAAQAGARGILMRPPSAPPHNPRQSHAFSEREKERKKNRLHKFRRGVSGIKRGKVRNSSLDRSLCPGCGQICPGCFTGGFSQCARPHTGRGPQIPPLRQLEGRRFLSSFKLVELETSGHGLWCLHQLWASE